MPEEIQDVTVELSEPQAVVMGSRAAVILDMAGQGGGKSRNIGFSTGAFVMDFPEVLQFIGANTYLQLTQSTLPEAMQTWREVYGLTEYDKKSNPAGAYVMDRRPPFHFDKIYSFKDYNNIASFWNGTTVFLGSLDNYKAHEGKQFAIAHLDETKDTAEAAVTEVILGRLRQYGLWYDQDGNIQFDRSLKAEQAAARGWTAWNPLYIHTSPALGGTPWLNEMFKLQHFEKEIKEKVLMEERGFFYREFENKAVVIYSTHHNLPNLPPNYIQNRKLTNTAEAIMRVVYGFPFGKTGGEYFPHFNREKHVKDCVFNISLPVNQAWDFNVVPYMTCLLIQVHFLTRYVDQVNVKHERPAAGYKALEVMVIRVYKEYCLESPENTTDHICQKFSEDHDPTRTEVNYYGDANGLHRIPGLGSVTNYKMIEAALEPFLHNFSKKVKDPNVAPGKRRDLLNRILEGKTPTVEIEIDPSCEKTINDMEQVKLGPLGKIKKLEKDERTGQKFQAVGHTSDALEYFVSEICKDFLD